MKEIKKILCAVDLSEHSAAVAEYATMLANFFARGGSIRVWWRWRANRATIP